MKRITFLITLLFALTCQAQLLWKVSGGTLEKPSYLFGTYHLMPSAFVDSVPGLNDAIKNVDAVWVEVENSQMTAPATVMKMSKMMIAPPDSTIDALLSKDAYQIVDTVVQRYLGTFGINLDKLKTMRPAALSTQLAQLMAVRRLPDFEMNNLLDGEVERRVKALGKPAHSLETVDFQLQLLLGDPLPKQAADLLEMCKNIGEVERNFDDMHNAYATQDFDKLMLAATDPSATTPEDMERICYDRNAKWLPTLIEAAPKGSILVAVGAAHLGMEKGLISLLRHQGYTVEPVK